MRRPFPFDRLNRGVFIELVVHDDLRSELMTFLAIDSSDATAATALIDVLAKECDATPDQLRRSARALEANGSPAAVRMLSSLVAHRGMPPDVLLSLADDPRLIPSLARRSSPRALLERLAEVHRHPDAIVTLALKYYASHGSPREPFRELISRYTDIPTIGERLRNAGGLEPPMRAVIRAVFGEE